MPAGREASAARRSGHPGRSTLPIRRATPAGPDEHGVAATVAALEAAVALRAPAVHASTPMVRELSVQIARQLGLDGSDQALVEGCARVRDVGMLGLPDEVVLATGPLSPEEWELVTRHPVLGAELLEDLAGMGHLAELVRAHHERWDGEGYPDGLKGERIPMLSRVIATADAFVAIASDRPYRKSAGAEAALEHLMQERGSQFAPRAVDALIAVLRGPAPAAAHAAPAGNRSARPRAKERDGGFSSALADFDVVAAFALAHERALTLATNDAQPGGDLVATIESDIGLTVAVLRCAREGGSRRAITNVSDAVAATGAEAVAGAVRELPRAAFPWRTADEALLHHVRVHSQAVARAADRIAREVGLQARDDLIAASLLHDVGKLVKSRLPAAANATADERSVVPEERVRLERRAMTVDHASLGSLLIQRWELPARLSETVAAHHSAADEEELATFLRLADMIAHHAQGDAVDRKVMLRLAAICSLGIPALRDILFDLPHAGGSQRRRAAPSPLSSRETVVLRALADGKPYKQIAQEIGLAPSTVRTHLHNIYSKLGVGDRAQAVLRATEMAWI